jgi:hypothetical protein
MSRSKLKFAAVAPTSNPRDRQKSERDELHLETRVAMLGLDAGILGLAEGEIADQRLPLNHFLSPMIWLSLSLLLMFVDTCEREVFFSVLCLE